MITNRTQSVYFYNTTGVIEREHNLFYAPRMPQADVAIRDTWLARFNSASKHDTTGSKYWRRTISQWSPEDRVLSIQGEIERFRRKDNNSNPFNYIIVEETLYTSEDETSTSETIYTGFFIIDAKQTGIGTVRLELEPDDFTNVFFLQNKNSSAQRYNINNYLRNAYVERQHYDRVEYLNGSLIEANLPIFSNLEESFKYKRQYRDRKEYINYGLPISEQVIAYYKNISSWSNLGGYYKELALKICCSFLHVIYNKAELILKYANVNTSIIVPDERPRNPLLPNKGAEGLFQEDESNLLHLMLPIPIIPDYLSQFSSEIKEIYKAIKIKTDFDGTEYTISSPTELSDPDYLFRNKYTPYIISAYVTKESSLFDDMTFYSDIIYVKLISQLTRGVTNYGAEAGKYKIACIQSSGSEPFYPNYFYGLYTETVGEGEQAETVLRLKYYTSTTDFDKTHGSDPHIYIFSCDKTKHFNLTLSHNNIPNLMYNYFDTCLDFEPYSFYALSYQGYIEVPLNRRNYYESENVTFDLNVVVTDTLKISLIPNYTIDNKKYKYYSEAVYLTLTNELALVTSRLNDYLVANKTQMKNQYAVNDMNLGKGLVSGITTGTGQGIRAGSMFADPVTGLITGGVQAGVEAVGSVITWAFNKQEIAMNQKAKLADIGNLPNNIKQLGTDAVLDYLVGEVGFYLNHYRIDELSYNSICKYLERYGYLVNIYDTINDYNRKGWNYVKLVDFEFAINVSVTQEETIRQIFTNGVTLLHEPSYLHSSSLHNYEIILD